MTDYLTVAERVQRGIKILDEQYEGENPWYNVVRTERLNIWSETNCVLGQLYENYFEAPIEFDGIPSSYGFDLNSTRYPEDRSVAPLNDEWIYRIEQLRRERNR